MTAPRPFVELFRDVVTAVQSDMLATLQDIDSNIQCVNFIAGDLDEIRETLQQFDASPEERFKKYPLFILKTDITELKGTAPGIYSKVRFQAAICHHTQREYKTLERYDNNFKPILYPLYESFIENLLGIGYFPHLSRFDLKHTKTDRVNLGKQALLELQEASYDYIDAIELNNFELNIDYDSCLTPITEIIQQ